MCCSKANGGKRCNGQRSKQDAAPATESATVDTPLTDKFLEENADKGPWPKYPGKGRPRTHGTDGDMGTRTNPWPNAPWDMSPGQKADYDYETPYGVGARDKEQAVAGWVKDKLAGRS